MQVAIDTSTDTASLAIVQDSEVLAELTWRCGQNHTTQLLPHLTHLLNQIKLSLQSTTGIIVARGPGSFNGLRVGISTAKGLAFSLGIPIVGISSLEAEAYQHAETGLPICPIFNAGRGEIATAIYQKKRNKWRQLIAEHIITVETLRSQITTKTMFCKTMSTLLEAGVSVVQTLDILVNMTKNDRIKQSILQVKERIVEGSDIAQALSASGFFPSVVSKMVQVGEESGSLPAVLDKTGDYYEKKVDSAINALMGFLEPIMIVVVGSIVLVIILALYLPIFSMSSM